MKNLLLLSLLLSGCVVKYGELPQPAATPPQAVDLRDEEAELIALRAAAEARDVDQRDRLDAALELIRQAESEDFSPRDVEDYLRRLIEVESRVEADTIQQIDAVGTIEEEELEASELEASEREASEREASEREAPAGDTSGERTGVTDEAALSFAREALAEEDYRAALLALEPLRDDPAAEALWWEAVNGYVHAERERAGELFLKARDMPQGEERTAAIRAVLELLQGLAEDYPGSEYEEALERNIGLVERALEESE